MDEEATVGVEVGVERHAEQTAFGVRGHERADVEERRAEHGSALDDLDPAALLGHEETVVAVGGIDEQWLAEARGDGLEFERRDRIGEVAPPAGHRQPSGLAEGEFHLGVALGVGVLQIERGVRRSEHTGGVGAVGVPVAGDEPVAGIPEEEVEIGDAGGVGQT